MKKRLLLGNCLLLLALIFVPFVTAQAAILQVGPSWPGTPYADIQSCNYCSC